MADQVGYNSGAMGLEGQDFLDEFLSEEASVVKEAHHIVVALMKSDEIDAIVEDLILGDQLEINPTITVEDRGGYWWISAVGKIELDMDVGTEIVGKDYNVYDLLVNVTTTVGRAYTLGNTFVVTSELVGLDSKLEDSA
ncbi:MAG: MmoB/DmpM family protein [Methylococcaceae bacterium]